MVMLEVCRMLDSHCKIMKCPQSLAKPLPHITGDRHPRIAHQMAMPLAILCSERALPPDQPTNPANPANSISTPDTVMSPQQELTSNLFTYVARIQMA